MTTDEESHLVVLRQECGLCGDKPVLVAVGATHNQHMCRSCAIAQFGRAWVDEALRVGNAARESTKV